jgi:hypothetical protein
MIVLLVPKAHSPDEDFDQKIVVRVFVGDKETDKFVRSAREILSEPPSFG